MRVLVLTGGDSGEREVSLASGAAVCRALAELGHHVQALDPATGQSLIDDQGVYQLPETGVPGEDMSESNGAGGLIKVLTTGEVGEIDVVFVALHGGAGENGMIQCLLDIVGIPYTGSGMAASAIAMDKATTKRLMASVDVPTPRWGLIEVVPGDDLTEVVEETHHQFKLPMIVKPNDGGSTIGLTKVKRPEDIEAALQLAARYSTRVLVEEFIDGRELTVAVLDGNAYPVVEIRPTNELYDYEAKYTKGKSEYIAPAPIDERLGTELQSAALRVFEAVGAAGLARVDFMVGDAGDFYCLELNTVPGLTELSLAPMAMNVEGIDFAEMTQLMLESALKKRG